jgi:hypothetical protein
MPYSLVSIVLDRSDIVLSIHDSSLLIKLCTITSTLGLLTDNDIVDLYGIGGRQVHSLKHFDLHVVKNFEPE